jgi:hypothetical protein
MKDEKTDNREGDVVLIHYQDKPMAYARIEAIEPDIKKDWYHVTLLLLTIPAQTVTWILREAYIRGELFTMGGQPVRLERVKKQKTEDRKQKEEKSKNQTKTWDADRLRCTQINEVRR